MHNPLWIAFGVAMLLVVVVALFSGKIIAGSRGFKANYYTRRDSPFLYYSFITIYLLIGLLILGNGL